jgi:opacity protein-like surface antigen
LNTGFEYAWNEMIFLRAGYKSLFERETEQGLTLGAGVSYRMYGIIALEVDYAYQDFGRLKNVHYFSLGLKF